MTEVPPGYMVLHDLRATHARRVRIMVLLISWLLLSLGSGYMVFFMLRGAWVIAAVDLTLVIVGAAAWLLMRRGHMPAAVTLTSLSLYFLFVGMAVFLDVPNPQVPRSVHHFLMPLAVACYLMMKNEDNWLKHALPVLCLATLALLVDANLAVATPYSVPDEVRRPGNWVNNTFAMGILYLLVHVFMGDITRMENYLHGANNRFVGLVRGVFPRSIAERLLAKGEAFAERHAGCSVLFADIVGFTGLTERMAPEALVDMLSRIFSRFDHCVEQAGLTKIKTIGDAYMVAAGVPEPHPQHARALVQLALAMQQQVHDFPDVQLRMGIASGELVAGVIGQTRQLFDVWGEVVNLAARMESQGVAGRVQVSHSCFELTREFFDFERQAGVTPKDRAGVLDAYLLVGAKTPGAAAA